MRSPYPIRIGLEQLLSPKALIPRDPRFVKLFVDIGSSGQTTPISVTPLSPISGSGLTPVLEVLLTKYRGL